MPKKSTRFTATPHWTAELEDGLSNLHDAYLSAHLMYIHMDKVPVGTVAGPLRSLLGDRHRYERLWVAFLFVLVEAWKANKMCAVTQWIQQVTDTAELASLLIEAGESGHLARMKKCRNYMFHRGWREYSDDGLWVPELDSDFHKKLYTAFANVLREAIGALNTAKRRK
jgi:hypothetical protein